MYYWSDPSYTSRKEWSEESCFPPVGPGETLEVSGIDLTRVPCESCAPVREQFPKRTVAKSKWTTCFWRGGASMLRIAGISLLILMVLGQFACGGGSPGSPSPASGSPPSPNISI